MTANVETMAYKGQVPWHGLGNTVSDQPTIEEMLAAAGLDWSVKKMAMFTSLTPSGHDLRVEDYYALLRDSDQSVLGVCGRDYIPTQNKQALEFFRRWAEAGHMTLETAGSLDGGRQVWALAKINESFSLFKEDKTDGYLLLSSPHIWGKSLQIKFTPIRVVCQNTLMMALSRGGETFRMPHRMEFDRSVMRTAEEALGVGIAQLKAYEETAKLLSQTECDSQSYYRFLMKLTQPAEFKSLEPDQTVNIADLNRNAFAIASVLNSQPGAQMKSSKNTWWGALNSLTYWADHRSGNTRDTALTAAWFGTKARLKVQALELAEQAANDKTVLLVA